MRYKVFFNGAKVILRQKNGLVYGCLWEKNATDEQIKHDMKMGDAVFYPWDESIGQVDWSSTNKPIRFRR